MDTSSPRKPLSIQDSCVGGEISSLKGIVSDTTNDDVIADLKKRTIILEALLLEKKEKPLSNSTDTTSEKT